MPVYEYAAIDAAGRQRKGIISAGAERAARQKLRAEGLYPTVLRESKAARPAAESAKGGGFSFSGRFGRVGQADLAVAFRQLAALLAAGLALPAAIGAVRDQTGSKRLERSLSQVLERVKEGASLAGAMGEHVGVFTPTMAGLVKAAESSGTLTQVIERLADLLERNLAQRRKIVSALAYPLLMLVVGIGVVALLLTYVVPTITAIFDDLGRELPAATAVLIAVSGFLKRYGALLPLAGLLVFICLWFYGKTATGRLVLAGLWLRLPVAGPVIRSLAAAGFARTLGTCLIQGLPIQAGLEIVVDALGNAVFRREAADIRVKVGEGVRLTDAMARKRVFPAMAVQLAAAGEQSGALGEMLIKAADMLDAEAAGRIAVLTALFEPVMILVLGALVGFIVLAVLLPIFEMSSLVG